MFYISTDYQLHSLNKEHPKNNSLNKAKAEVAIYSLDTAVASGVLSREQRRQWLPGRGGVGASTQAGSLATEIDSDRSVPKK